jgi:tRNA 2-thiouridine synthesizing protein B
MLHIVNKSPFEKRTLESCLRFKRKGSALLLIEDGVYAAADSNIAHDGINEALRDMPIYALAPDLKARGLQDRVIEGITLVDYGGFVDLVAEHKTNQSWL